MDPTEPTPAPDSAPAASPLVPLSSAHASAVAGLHSQSIHTGFLSSLGTSFLRQLYTALARCPSGFGYVWVEPDGEAMGFIACAESTSRVYREALRRRFVRMLVPLLRHLARRSVVQRMEQTLRYPAELSDDLPPAEVLSIAVSDRARGKGVGKALMAAAMAEFGRRGMTRVKVAVAAANEPANRFYRSCGFQLALQREHHGQPMNIYTLDVHHPARPCPDA